jgi:hypothetical protein
MRLEIRLLAVGILLLVAIAASCQQQAAAHARISQAGIVMACALRVEHVMEKRCFSFQVAEGNERAQVEVHGSFTAAEVERLIGELSAVRAAMSPQVPASPPARCPEDAAAVRAGGDPCVQVAVMRDGLTRFWVRHAGLGWFGFNLPVDRASTLANYILGVTHRNELVADAFRAKRRKSDLSH